MIRASLLRLERMLDDSALVLDIGGWGRPLARADWVVDHMPYETRGLYGRDGDGAERFTRDTWVVRDIADRAPFPFTDKQFDFVVCSHTLEDIRDPIWVCSEINRIGKAGYLETPSRLEEQSYGIQGPWVGWGHHRWLVEMDPAQGVTFVFKHHVMHGRESDHFPRGFWQRLPEDERVARLWWEGSFEYREHIFTAPEELDAYLADFVAAQLRLRPMPASRRAPLRRLAGALQRSRTGL